MQIFLSLPKKVDILCVYIMMQKFKKIKSFTTCSIYDALVDTFSDPFDIACYKAPTS